MAGQATISGAKTTKEGKPNSAKNNISHEKIIFFLAF